MSERKDIDSLIVTDLIDLARLKSICDTVLSSVRRCSHQHSDARFLELRIHLFRDNCKSRLTTPTLMQEADTASEWQTETIAKFLSVRPSAIATIVAAAMPSVSSPAGSAPSEDERIEAAVNELVGGLEQADLDGIAAYWKTERGVPAEFDRRLLPCAGKAVGRRLERIEIKFARACFQGLVKARLA